MKKWKEKIRRIKEERAQNAPESMTEEERLQHEKYVAELTAENQRIVRKITTVLWCLAMVGWVIFLVLDVVYYAGPIKILFHAAGAVLTALLALPRVIAWLAAKRKKSEETAADTDA